MEEKKPKEAIQKAQETLRKRALREQNYVSKQRQRIHKITLLPLFLCLSLGFLYLLPLQKSEVEVQKVVHLEPQLYKLQFSEGAMRVKSSFPPNFAIGSKVKIIRVPILGDLVKVQQGNKSILNALPFQQYLIYVYATVVLALITYWQTRKDRLTWFPYWFFTLVGTFIVCITFIITR